MPGYVDSTRSNLNAVLVGPSKGNFNAAGASVERYRRHVDNACNPGRRGPRV